MKKIIILIISVILISALFASCGTYSGVAEHEPVKNNAAVHEDDSFEIEDIVEKTTELQPRTAFGSNLAIRMTVNPGLAVRANNVPQEDQPGPVPGPAPVVQELTEGLAGAYGGSGSRTATGEVIDETSMGVAIPMSMPDYRSYFGRAVEIRYNGTSVIATVNDCGSLGGGKRALDLQPGIFRAFGFASCNAWGVRSITYRFL